MFAFRIEGYVVIDNNLLVLYNKCFELHIFQMENLTNERQISWTKKFLKNRMSIQIVFNIRPNEVYLFVFYRFWFIFPRSWYFKSLWQDKSLKLPVCIPHILLMSGSWSRKYIIFPYLGMLLLNLLTICRNFYTHDNLYFML